MKTIKESFSNQYLHNFLKSLFLISSISISRNLSIARKHDNHLKYFHKMSVINIVLYYYKMTIRNSLKNNFSNNYNNYLDFPLKIS